MYVVVNRVKVKGSFKDASSQAEAGLLPILRQSPGFVGRYNIDAGDGVGVGITVFESAGHWAAAVPAIADWVGKHIYPLYESEPTMTCGDLIYSEGPDLSALLR
ncbi:hypothetical protein EDF56_105135 [Novosphingobium sp. PhB165]|uniref:hypothetical protein n=1 Tax=Novosphingobium sp. PhB165 TaxID=2485105 RepID=UPI0010468904|nr:hypothetical protein [Novosphingobium sp. PhB165]TCM17792.1 hypothetical protein EDF56_105135 [Novosphingobium sp. PhB165]